MTDTNLGDNTKSLPQNLPISLIPFEVQLQNVVPIEVVAKRFPVNIFPETPVNIHMNMVELSVDSDSQNAQIIWEIQLTPTVEPRPFEITIKIVGVFSYSAEYSISDVEKYLRRGSLSVILPIMRELVLSLSMRLQIPPITLPLVKVTNPAEAENSIDE